MALLNETTVTDRPEPTTRSEELTYLFFALWTLVGLCLDGWAHRHQPELESFFTPWHTVFYTGFIGAVAWLAVIVIRRRSSVPDLVSAIPDGFQLAVVGLVVFAIGGVGDGIWHTAFGVETSLDALLSPTHLLMLVGMLGGSTAPLRSAWRRSDRPTVPDRLGPFLPVVLSAAVATTSVAFFFLYANGFNNWPVQFAYTPPENEVSAALGIVATLLSTVILLTPVLIMLRRWRPPFGTFTLLFSIVGIFMAGLDAFEFWWQVIAPVVGGVVTDAIVDADRLGGLELGARSRAIGIGLVTPTAMWSASFAATHVAWGVGWPPELWAGSIVLSALTGLGLALLAFPPALPPAVDAELGGGGVGASGRPPDGSE